MRDSDDIWQPVYGNHRSIDAIERVASNFTGLYNANGEPIYRERTPIGFKAPIKNAK